MYLERVTTGTLTLRKETQFLGVENTTRANFAILSQNRRRDSPLVAPPLPFRKRSRAARRPSRANLWRREEPGHTAPPPPRLDVCSPPGTPKSATRKRHIGPLPTIAPAAPRTHTGSCTRNRSDGQRGRSRSRVARSIGDHRNRWESRGRCGGPPSGPFSRVKLDVALTRVDLATGLTTRGRIFFFFLRARRGVTAGDYVSLFCAAKSSLFRQILHAPEQSRKPTRRAAMTLEASAE